jgi:hypothetical protein
MEPPVDDQAKETSMRNLKLVAAVSVLAHVVGLAAVLWRPER